MIHTGQSHIQVPDGTDALEFRVLLTDEEREEIRTIIDEFPPFDLLNIEDDLLTMVELAGKRMPSRIAELLIRFRRNPNPYGTLLFRNVPLDLSLPETPRDGRYSREKSSHVSEYVLLLFMLFLGEPIAYLDEKEGRLIQDICPVSGQESKQENTGSAFLEFHTEDGFHPYKPDHLALFCLRADHEQIAETATASIRNVLHELPSTAITLLRQPLYRLRMSTSFTGGEQVNFSAKLAVLTGSLLEPDMCIDYYLMEAITPEAQWALDVLKAALLRVARGVVLLPGDLIIIDNRLAAHARTAFLPRYDGEDRWLQRLFTVQDFRRSSFSRIPRRHVCTPLRVEFSLDGLQVK